MPPTRQYSRRLSLNLLTTSTTTLFLTIFVLLSSNTKFSQAQAEVSAVPGIVKDGRCPKISPDTIYSKQECTAAVSECSTDGDCEDVQKCCSNGCAQVCTTPLVTGCQQLRSVFQRDAEVWGEIYIPKCRESGEFEPVQCNRDDGKCWCVDQLGFERPGTRARSLDSVNCTAPAKCAGHVCRMFCPYGFELDDEGCPLCECRNPCKNKICPGGQECIVESAPCADVTCPPLPKCKRPRSLDDQCDFGEPLNSPDRGKPFLCGVEVNKPQCPANFVCNVNRGNDYGVCCPLLDKPGQCPKDDEVGELECDQQQSCKLDMDCGGPSKCCESQKCGKVCLKPGNTTLCQQQKMVVELLITNNPSYEAYIPQCSEEGEFVPRQCTTNGRLCWCVDEVGAQMKGSLGPAHTVFCSTEARSSASVCPDLHCNMNCSFGYKSDDDGCTKCECLEPCQDITCPEDAKCVVMKEDPCVSGHCPPIATCMRENRPTCARGSPLVDVVSGDTVTCDPNSNCPFNFKCEVQADQDSGICCPALNTAAVVTEDHGVREPQCPNFVPPPTSCENMTCTVDSDCQDGMKCCQEEKCGSVCAHPRPPRLPTMCEYLRDMSKKLDRGNNNATLALPVPSCREDGSYEPIQCNEVDSEDSQCWCVDEFGSELINTRAAKNKVDCREVRALRSCLGLLCRLGCDYGFEMDDEGCPYCECRNPCNHAKCDETRECQMVQAPCDSAWCPHVPQCVPKQVESRVQGQSSSNHPSCPVGNPLMYQENNVPVTCEPMAPYQQCPDSHMCVALQESEQRGICCPRIILQPNNNNDVIALERAETSNQDSAITGKAGQCPYLIPAKHDSCEFQCTTDTECADDLKCCSNGCGTQCMKPLLLTACLHEKLVAEHRAREDGIPASQTYIPGCNAETGAFKPTQCDPVSGTCWCVDENGFELPGTRGLSNGTMDCTQPEKCYPANCDLNCPNGLQMGGNNCFTCACRDPCDKVKCEKPGEQCRAIQVNCASGPCPPIALCMPDMSNPCPEGEPLLNATTGEPATCGPSSDSCPSSHKCHLSPLGQFSVCCPKPRDVCYQPQEIGMCKAAKHRWYFNARKNSCEEFLYGGCNGNLNRFDSKEDCETTCPVMSECERIRERNLKIKKNVNKIVFLPKCDKKTGDWESVQCLDALGLCWCVNKEGDQQPGSVIRGTPACSSRGGRNLGEIPICANGLPVYQCPDDLCSRASCVAYPNATCRVDPCGGCEAKFFDNRNQPVSCSKDLTACMGEVQDVLDSSAWVNKIKGYRRASASIESYIEEGESVDTAMAPVYPPPPPPPMPVVVSRTLLGRFLSGALSDQMTSDSEYGAVRHQGPISVTSRIAVVIGPRFGSLSVRVPQVVNPFSSIMARMVADEVHEAMVSKPGLCPPPSFWSLIRSMSWRCRHKCLTDSQCDGHQKCCMGDCGMECVEPNMDSFENFDVTEKEAAESSFAFEGSTSEVQNMMKVHMPNCSKVGGYAVVQRQGEFAWCVDKYGRPIHDSLTKGFVKCSRNGTVVDRQSLGPICPDSQDVKPKVCREECLKAYCPQHPEAICVADPCNRCAVHFVNENGEKVNCEDKCSQKLKEGHCGAAMSRFFFNQDSQRCEEFSYTGCGGNDNNFLSMDECHKECVLPKPVCEQLMEVGMCRAQISRWFYNKHTHECEEFKYGGCGGNDNNFASKEECQARCPDMVYCPWASVTQELEPCSRSRICANVSCPGNAEAVCTVDPCTCTPVFVDRAGQNVDCQPPTAAPDIVIPLVTSETRCEHTRSVRSNDVALQHEYVPVCDMEGKFSPTQCMKDKSTGKEECWCVDEAGIQLPESNTFTRDKGQCKFVPIKSVDITLTYRHEGSPLKTNTAESIKSLSQHLLKRLDARVDGDLTVEPSSRMTKVTFSLIGDNKVDSAFRLEEMVKTGGLLLQMNDGSMVADYRRSHFYYISDYVSPDVEVFDNRIPDTHMAITAISRDGTATLVAITLVITILVVLILIALVSYYRGKNSGETPRNSLVSLAFNSPLYGFITGKSQAKPNPYDTVKKNPGVAIQTVESEYESIQNEMNVVKKVALQDDIPPPAYPDLEKQLEKKIDVENDNPTKV